MIDETNRPTDIETEAADWYARLNSNVVDNADLARFEAWRRSSPEHRAVYDRVSAAAATLRALRGDPGLEALADEALKRAARAETRRGRLGGRIGVGAGLLLAAGLVVGAISLGQGAGQRYESKVGERKVVRLDDGSEVILNTDSRIAVKLTRQARRITLVRGQALFEVAHDKSRPFVVRAGDTSITAVGTRFDVYRRPDAVQVTLSEGKVAVQERANPARSWTLSPGQKIVVGGSALAKPSAADLAADTSWTSGQLVFHNTPLGQAVREVNRYSARKVTLADGAPHDLRINGTFPTGDIDGFALAASNMLDLERHPIEGAQAIELRAKSPPPP